MKKLYKFLCLIVNFQLTYSVDFLDNIINQKIQAFANTGLNIKKIQKCVDSIGLQSRLSSLESLQDLLEITDYSAALSSSVSADIPHDHNNLEDLKFFMGAKFYFHYLACCKQKMLNQAVKNYETLNFWSNEKFYEHQSLYQKNVFRWLSRSSYHKKIDENIHRLKIISEETNYFLGLITYNQNLLLQATTEQEIIQVIIKSIMLQNKFFNLADQQIDFSSMQLMVKKSILQALQFDNTLSEEYKQCQLPSYMHRYWKEQIATTVGLCACAYIYLKYGKDIAQSSQHFWEDHIKEPLERNIQNFTRIANYPKLNTQREEELLQALKDNCLSPNQSDLSQEEKDQIIKDQDKILIANPVINLPRALFNQEHEKSSLSAQVGAYNRFGLELLINTKIQANQILKDAHMILGLTALIPVVTLTGVVAGSLFASKTLYNSVAYQPIRTFVRHLDSLFNESLSKQPSFSIQGAVYFFTEQLKLHVGVLTITEQQLMQADIIALQDINLSYVQKYNVVQRMYKTYPCLLPGAI